MKRFILFILLILVAVGVGVYYYKFYMETKIIDLKEAIKYVKSEYAFAKIKIKNINSGGIDFTLYLFDNSERVVSSKGFSLPGTDIFLESKILIITKEGETKSLIFPFLLYTDEIAPNDGTEVLSMYVDGNKPKNYKGSEEVIKLSEAAYLYLFKGLINDNLTKSTVLEAVLHKDMAQKMEIGKSYICIIHPNGGLELMEENNGN